jgi:hypothetical protein
MSKVLTSTVINPWKTVVEKFSEHEQINKAGWMASRAGWVWFNFFWVRASYLKRVVCPTVVSSDRYYYESWLGRLSTNGTYCPLAPDTYKGVFLGAHDSLTLCLENARIGEAFDPNEFPCMTPGKN